MESDISNIEQYLEAVRDLRKQATERIRDPDPPATGPEGSECGQESVNGSEDSWVDVPPSAESER